MTVLSLHAPIAAVTPGAPGAPRADERASRSFFPEIQVLRAAAVMLVVLYHYWPDTLTGGFVGVDAFFVISGYLITSHLIREVERTGSLKLWAFYARRARRLLPASIFVLLFAALGTILLLPMDLWASTAHELTASGFYVQNLWLASKAVTYSASNDVASPVLHYWSLSAEEQFYLVWPSLIIISLLVARKWLRGHTTTTIGFTLLLVTLSSFAISVWATQTHRAAAYFITPTRAWEFGAGALVVLLMRKWAPSLTLSRLLRWLGMIGLLASAWFFSNATPFPGYAAALPVIATAAVIVAGDTGRADPSDVVFRLRPVQWLGDVSYSVYLWHWPLMVFAPYVLRHSLKTPELVALVLLCLVVSGLSKRFVEDATRFWPRLTRTPRATLLAAGAGMLVIALVSGTQLYAASVRERQTEALLADVSGNPCFGAPAMGNRATCPDVLTGLPLAAVTKSDSPWAPEPGCDPTSSDLSVLTCYWGTGKPSRVVALVGDSHARHWRGALHRIAKAKNWQVIELLSEGCPATSARSIVFERRSRDGDLCRTWSTKATAELKALHPDDIITSAFAQQNVFEPRDSGPMGFEQVWRQWLTFTRVTVLRDIPTTANRSAPQCLAVNVGKQQLCSNPRSKVLIDDDMMRAARAMRHEVNLVDLSDYFCDDSRCYAVIGGASVYYDYDHMSLQFSASLASPLLRQLPVP
ncbi:MAG TPA: acyltransferase family protein [Dermatophilaceae bacterium]|nr:acyltransferase family protein [Dermatophilaceae bacterium]